MLGLAHDVIQQLKQPPLLYSSRLGWRVTGDAAREKGVSVRDQLLARLGDTGGDDGEEPVE